MKRQQPKPTQPQQDRFAGVRPHLHSDDDDRANREDRAPLTSQLFSSPVTLPRFLRPRKLR